MYQYVHIDIYLNDAYTSFCCVTLLLTATSSFSSSFIIHLFILSSYKALVESQEGRVEISTHTHCGVCGGGGIKSLTHTHTE